MKQLVLPIKDTDVLREVEDILPHNFREGRRDYIVFQIGKTILLRVSDVLALRRDEIYRTDGDIKKNTYIRGKKTGKPNISYLKPVKQDLIDYFNWLDEQNIQLEWLFPSSRDHFRHIAEKQFYKIMARTDDLLEIDYLGTHGMKRIGAYRIHAQTHYSIGLIVSLLNHTSEAMASKYPGSDQVSREKTLDEVEFD